MIMNKRRSNSKTNFDQMTVVNEQLNVSDVNGEANRRRSRSDVGQMTI
jgi:hypothetical protein